MIVDNVSVSPLPVSCDNPVRNPSFEHGDYRFWERSGSSVLDVSDDAYNGNYALQMTKESARQILQPGCFKGKNSIGGGEGVILTVQLFSW